MIFKIKMKHGKESCIRSFNDYFEALACCTFLNSRFDFIMGIFSFYLCYQAILVNFIYDWVCCFTYLIYTIHL